MIKKALGPIRRRIRLLRAAHGLLTGLLLGAAASLTLTAVSFFIPIDGLWRYLAVATGACALFCPAIGALLPVPPVLAARYADAAGLMERTRTALAFEGEDGAMFRLQREDARVRLAALPIRQAFPFRPIKRVWLPAAACALLVGALLMLPNPQHDALRARALERRTNQAQADTVEKAAEAISEQSLTDEERRELRRLTGEMARDLREASDTREALAALDEKQRQMDRLQKEILERITRETSQALGSQPGLKGLADAVGAGDTQQAQAALAEIAEALQSGDLARALGEQLAQAAALAPEGAVQQGLSDAAAAAASGNSQLAAQALSGALESAGATGADVSALMGLARAGVAQAGTGAGQGGMGQGQGAGGGAGLGTTQRDAGYTPGLSQSSQQAGKGAITDRVGTYERIYDPTRLGGDNEASFVEGRIGEGDSQQLQLGPGIGDLSGSVPYDQVIGEYSQAAAQAMRRTPLPAAMQDWVTRYFDALVP